MSSLENYQGSGCRQRCLWSLQRGGMGRKPVLVNHIKSQYIQPTVAEVPIINILITLMLASRDLRNHFCFFFFFRIISMATVAKVLLTSLSTSIFFYLTSFVAIFHRRRHLPSFLFTCTVGKERSSVTGDTCPIFYFFVETLFLMIQSSQT